MNSCPQPQRNSWSSSWRAFTAAFGQQFPFNRLSFAPLLAGAGSALAVCPADVGTGMTVSANNSCSASASSYSRAAPALGVIRADGANAVVTLSAPEVTVTNTSLANAAYGLDARSRGSIIATGNLTVITRGVNGRAILVSANSSVAVAGDLLTRNLVSHSGAGIQVEGGAQFSVAGSTQTSTHDADGLRIFGNGTFGNTVTVSAFRRSNSASLFGALVNGTARFDGDLLIDYANLADNTATYGFRSTGTSSVARQLTVSASGDNARGVNVNGGTASVQGGLRVSTDGANGLGILVNGAAASLLSPGPSNSVSTLGSGAHGLLASGDGSLIALGASSPTTSGPTIALGAGSSVSTAGAGAHGLVLTSAAGSARVLLGGTVAASGLGANGIDASGVAGGVSITQTGDVSAPNGLAIRGSAAADSVQLLAGRLLGDSDLGAGQDSMQASGGALSGALRMGDGDDGLWAGGSVDLLNTIQLDGGAGADTLSLDGIFLRGFTDASNGASGNLAGGNNTQLSGWETIQLSQGATLKLSGDLFVPAAPGLLQIGRGTRLDLRGDSPGIYTIHGHVTQAGAMAMDDGAPDDVTTVTGNYSGAAGAVFQTDATWAQPNRFATDQLLIQGSASGATTVTVAGGILGDVVRADNETISSVPVIQVAQAHADRAFVGVAATPNAGEAQLRKIGNDYFWTLEAQVSPTETVAIIGSPVTAYLLGPVIAQEMGFGQTGKYHERIGEQQIAWSGCGRRCAHERAALGRDTGAAPLWGRVRAQQQELQGLDRFATEGRSGFIQFGSDVSVELDARGRGHHRGVMASYGWGHFDNHDALRANNGLVVADKFTGRTEAQQAAIGGYSTWHSGAGGYVDLVGHAALLINRYSSADSTRGRHRGRGLGLSVEAGQAMPLGNASWTVEPQLQLAYQHVAFRELDDGTRRMRFDSRDGLRGRAGARLVWAGADSKTRTVYVTGNLLRDFGPARAGLAVGRDLLSERLARNWAELGLGAQWAIGGGSHLYGDLRVQRSLGGQDGALLGASRSATALNLGMRTAW